MLDSRCLRLALLYLLIFLSIVFFPAGRSNLNALILFSNKDCIVHTPIYIYIYIYIMFFENWLLRKIKNLVPFIIHTICFDWYKLQRQGLHRKCHRSMSCPSGISPLRWTREKSHAHQDSCQPTWGIIDKTKVTLSTRLSADSLRILRNLIPPGKPTDVASVKRLRRSILATVKPEEIGVEHQ